METATEKPKRDEFNFPLSQSVVKSFQKYKMGIECGHKFYHKNILRNPIMDEDNLDSEAIRMGNYFEYLVTGETSAKFKPEPELYQIGANKGMIKPNWKQVEVQALRAKSTMQQYGFETVSVNQRYEHNGLSMICDHVLKDQHGNDVIVDYKYTSKINSRSWDNGWDLRTLSETDHLIQAVHSSLLWQRMTGRKPRFFFYLASSTDPNDAKFIEIEIPDWNIEMHEREVQNVRELIELEATIGFRALPEIKRCAGCPLLSTEFCDSGTLIPLIETYTVE